MNNDQKVKHGGYKNIMQWNLERGCVPGRKWKTQPLPEDMVLSLRDCARHEGCSFVELLERIINESSMKFLYDAYHFYWCPEAPKECKGQEELFA